MTGPVLYSGSGRQQKCLQSSSSLIILGITFNSIASTG